MANSLSAKKRIRQNEKRRLRNRGRKEILRKEIRKFSDAVKKGNNEEIPETLKSAQRALDKAGTKGLLHRRTVDRRKARLALAANRALTAAQSE